MIKKIIGLMILGFLAMHIYGGCAAPQAKEEAAVWETVAEAPPESTTIVVPIAAAKPAPAATQTAAPTATAKPTVKPSATPKPNLTATPSAKPTATPAPKPTVTATPVPVPESTPIPVQDMPQEAVPAPTSDPVPDSGGVDSWSGVGAPPSDMAITPGGMTIGDLNAVLEDTAGAEGMRD